MTRQQSFGGPWTQDKLNRLQGYLSRNSPMFLLCFASANKTGVKIADWLLTNAPKRKRGR